MTPQDIEAVYGRSDWLDMLAKMKADHSPDYIHRSAESFIHNAIMLIEGESTDPKARKIQSVQDIRRAKTMFALANEMRGGVEALT